MTDEKPEVVIFRRWRGTGDIVALFPEIPGLAAGRLCQAYEHVGQHCAAHYHIVIDATVPASDDESGRLKRELERIGYKLRPLKRAMPVHHERRLVRAQGLTS